MSNNAVGALYKRIIDQVIEASRTDFEENGVDNRMIATLQETWQQRLSQKHSAHFPWEPQPPPPSETSTAPTPSVPSRQTQTKAASNITAPVPPQPQPQAPHVHIKQEPGTGNSQSFMNLPQSNPYATKSDVAQQRAIGLVQQRIDNNGNPTASSMGALGNIQLPSQQQNMQQDQKRPGSAYSGQYPNAQYGPQQQQRPPQMLKQEQQLPQLKRPHSPAMPHIKQENDDSFVKREHDNSLVKAQMDGAGDTPSPSGDWSAVMAHRAAAERDGPTNRHKVDGMIRQHVAQNMQRLEGGGLLVPLEERYPRGHPLRRAHRNGKGKGKARATLPTTQAGTQSGTNPAQLDGGADDESSVIKPDSDADVDAINSDLDDSDDEVGDGMIGDDYEGNQIICLYDKVQRVKNKWKCTLKDGVVDVDGKDYVFHKATGEFEW